MGARALHLMWHRKWQNLSASKNGIFQTRQQNAANLSDLGDERVYSNADSFAQPADKDIHSPFSEDENGKGRATRVEMSNSLLCSGTAPDVVSDQNWIACYLITLRCGKFTYWRVDSCSRNMI